MKLRKLKRKDAPFMLEWMHDPAVVGNLKTDFANKTIEDCKTFIDTSQNEKENIHLAIVNDNDEYMGTVSLKHVTASEAEFAITVRKSAMGKGFSKYGMEEVVRYGFDDLGLECVYWCVSPENKRALRFYDKNGYMRINPLKAPGGVLARANQTLYLVQSRKAGVQGGISQLNTEIVSPLGIRVRRRLYEL